MTTIKRALIALGLLICPLALAQTATINWTSPQQTIVGFGGANEAQFANMTNSALVFGNAPGQLGYTALRPGVANGGDMPGSCTTVNSGCAGLISDMQAVNAAGGVVVPAPWSLPASMKSNSSTKCSPGSGILSPGSYGAGATYLSNYITSVKNFAGVTIYALAVQNEPDFCPPYDGTLYSGPQLQTFIKNNLGPTLASAGQTATLISLSDSAHYSGLSSIATPCATDPTCNAFVGAYSFHPYDASVSGSTVGSMPLPSGLSSSKGYFATEMSQSNSGGTGYGPSCSSYTTFVNTISDGLCWGSVWDQLLNNNVNLIMYWQINDFGGTAPPTATNTSLISNAAAGSVVTKRAYVLAQYAKFVRPGYQRIAATARPLSTVSVTAYKSGNNLSAVLTNYDTSSHAITLTLTNAPNFTTLTPTITSATQNIVALSSVAVSGNSVTYTVPAQSIVTLTGTGTSAGCTFSGANTYTPSDNSQAAVNNCINGPGHVAVAGDTINIPAGSVTWTSGISKSGVGFNIIGSGVPNSLPSQFGQGTVNTSITQNTTAALFNISNVPVGQTMRISSLNLAPQAGLTTENMPIEISGTCDSTGCPNVRVDNINFDAAYTNDPAAADMAINNLYGVLDHNNANGTGEGAPAALVQSSFSAWLGVGANGDNSFAAPDSVGTLSNLFLENNHLNNARGTENDVGFNGLGGDRTVVRYNLSDNTSAIGIFNSHGTAWTGRDRGSRQKEVYRNTVNCVYSGGCGGGSYNSGTGYVFQNHFVATSPGFFNHYFTIDSPRVWRAVASWGYCDGTGNYDTNDGTVYATGTVTSGSGSSSFTDTSKSWTTNQWTPNGAPYAIHNTSQAFGGALSSNTSNTYTMAENGPFGQTWVAGNGYQILRSSVCLDQAGRSGGTLLSGTAGPNGGPTPTGANNQTLDPIYEAADTNSGGFGVPVAPVAPTLIANRDYYAEASNQTAQTSATSPFNGTSGTGHGLRSLRPTSCTSGTAYLSTDQGSWNQSGDGLGSGVWDKCVGGVWQNAAYTPAIYPNPLVSGTPQASAPSFSPVAGSYTSAQSITITDATPSSTIFYTTDGSTPTTSSSVYFSPIAISVTSTLQAMATAPGFTQSATTSGVYTISGSACSNPSQNAPFSGTYAAGSYTITWTNPTAGCALRYTIDGSAPTVASPTYPGGGLVISSTTTIRVIATQTGFTSSSIQGGTWTITSSSAAAPTFLPASPYTGGAISVTISSTTPASSISYCFDTLNTCVPGTAYVGPVSFASTGFIRAFANAAGFTQSTTSSWQGTFPGPPIAAQSAIQNSGFSHSIIH